MRLHGKDYSAGSLARMAGTGRRRAECTRFRYHIDVGWPLLEEGARFEAPIARTLWASDSVAAQGASHLVLGRRSRGRTRWGSSRARTR